MLHFVSTYLPLYVMTEHWQYSSDRSTTVIQNFTSIISIENLTAVSSLPVADRRIFNGRFLLHLLTWLRLDLSCFQWITGFHVNPRFSDYSRYWIRPSKNSCYRKQAVFSLSFTMKKVLHNGCYWLEELNLPHFLLNFTKIFGINFASFKLLIYGLYCINKQRPRGTATEINNYLWC